MTLSDIYTPQVLNHLAMFVQNPHALPFFAFPNQGTTRIQDMGSIGGPGSVSSRFATGPFDLNASRQATENRVLEPVRDPAKLLTRLTLAILDYAVNDPEQFARRAKQVKIYLDEDGEFTTRDKAVTKISATIPIDQRSGDLAVLDNGVVWSGFFKDLDKKSDADQLLREERGRLARAGTNPSVMNTPRWWSTITPENYSPGVRKAASFFKENASRYNILPQDVPSEELLNGPATFEHKGSASGGLQMLQQKLKAASPP